MEQRYSRKKLILWNALLFIYINTLIFYIDTLSSHLLNSMRIGWRIILRHRRFGGIMVKCRILSSLQAIQYSNWKFSSIFVYLNPIIFTNKSICLYTYLSQRKCVFIFIQYLIFLGKKMKWTFLQMLQRMQKSSELIRLDLNYFAGPNFYKTNRLFCQNGFSLFSNFSIWTILNTKKLIFYKTEKFFKG